MYAIVEIAGKQFKVEKNKFPLVGLLKKLPKYPSLFETVLITINDYLVYKFLDKRINFQDLTKLINKISNSKEFQKFKKIKPCLLYTSPSPRD